MRFRMITGGEVLDAIKHLVSMSADAPLRTGNVYVDWLKTREENSAPSTDNHEDWKSINMDDAFLMAWSELIKSYSDQQRLARHLDSSRKELLKDSKGSFSLTIYVNSDAQADWIREKKLKEMEVFLMDQLKTPIRLQVETEK